jgi:oligoendopeptidase F
MSSVPERSDIDDVYKWDLESIYATDEDWEAAYEAVESRLGELGSYEGRVTADGETLLEVLQLREELMRTVEQVTAYARMRSDEDTREQEYQGMKTRAQSLSAAASSAASFIEPEIQSCTRAEIGSMIESTDGLGIYEHYLEDTLRMKDHTRSTEVESLLSELGEVLSAPGETFSMLTNADLDFPTVERPDGEAVEITQANLTSLLKEPDREFRQTVHEAFYDELGEYRNTIGTTLSKAVKSHVKLAEARNYESAREASLDGPNVPTAVYDNLIDAVRDDIDVLHRHAELKREARDLPELRMWDLYTPMTETEGPDLGYEEATEHVIEALAPLGEDYQSRVAEGIESRWVDVYENRGKRSGAYSGGTYDTQPFILMNWQEDVSDMFTLAHELGHSLHSQLTSESQPHVYADYDIFVAEVASTVNETLLTHHLLDTVEDEDFRRHVLNEYLERFRSTLFRQTLFADFERRVHEKSEAGEPLTPDRLDELYRELKAEFYEPAELDDRIEREWMRIPHFYYDFYVYQYATGISAAVAIVERIREQGDPAARAYLDALELGGSAYPIEVLETAGIDMSSPEPIERAISVYDGYLGEMAGLI